MKRLFTYVLLVLSISTHAAERPNILWIVSEDNGPHMGCYGDALAVTPNLDALAARGVIYKNAWSTVPVCAPARTAIITGMYPSSLGAEHMRSMALLPEDVKLYPELLRAAGYYCTNNAKEDYNVPKPEGTWDVSSRQGHWKNRTEGQPFFAVFNLGVTHESQIRKHPHDAVQDPAKMVLPAYYPDTPETRRDWAQYYDKMTMMDAQAGRLLQELEDAGLMDDTIILYYGDHGVGLPRGKRSTCNSGLQVPLIAVVPDKFKHLMPQDYVAGGESTRLVGFVDLAPTLLTLAGADVPANMQGQPFLGAKNLPEKKYLFGLRGRMDERVDFVRAVRDKRYVYVRNYMPHLPHLQHVAYMYQTPTTQAWDAAYRAGTLSEESAYFFGRRDSERLYDLEADPDEMHSLVDSPEHAEVLERMRGALKRIQLETRDTGFIPEPDMRMLYADEVFREFALDDDKYPLELILDVAERATREEPDVELLNELDNAHPVVRYWALMSILTRATANVEFPPEELAEGDEPNSAFKLYSRKRILNPNVKLNVLEAMLDDESTAVRIASAELLAEYGSERQQSRALQVLLELSNVDEYHVQVATSALNAIDRLDGLAAPTGAEVEVLPVNGDNVPGRNRMYVIDLKAAIAKNLLPFFQEKER